METSYSLQDSLGFLVSHLAGHLHVLVGRALEEQGVTGAQWAVLFLVAEGRATSPAALSAALSIDAGAVTRLLDRLEAKQLIERQPHPTDRRSTLIRLTEHARQRYPALPPLVAGVIREVFSGVPAEDLVVFKRVLVQVLERMPVKDVPPADVP